jgi:chromosome segregation protein
VYLKRLELQGFKSFAPRTVLEFSPGITAIVGPNGSGKSNIADGIRWVLGEQSMRQLRGKKSDDIIFAGGQHKAQMQMAEVTLVLDNSAGWLPSEHSEVTGTRRIFRSGESEYLINGQRVRLRDLLLLLSRARIGHDSYTVIGQGLVDQALSLRADERRALFEDAAGIRQFQAQRADAEQKLALTQGNLGRLHDILGEIEPRLAPLAEQARRAKDYSTSREDLRGLVRVWFAWQWQDATTRRDRSRAAEATLASGIEAIRSELDSLEQAGQQAKFTREEAQARVVALRRTRSEESSRLQAIEQDLAVGQERLTSLARQADEIEFEQGDQEMALAAAQAHADTLDEQVATTEREAAATETKLSALEKAQHGAHTEQERADAAHRAAQRDAVQAQARLGAAQTELGRLQRQLGERNRTLATRQSALNAAERKLEAARVTRNTASEACDSAQHELEGLTSQRETARRAAEEGRAEADGLRTDIADAQRERRALLDRLTLLQEWRDGQSNQFAGARALIQAPEDARPPVWGLLSNSIEVKPGYEMAVEAALGELLSAVVVTSAADALRCASWLREQHGGPAIFIWPPADAESATAKPSKGNDPLSAHVKAGALVTPIVGRLLDGISVVEEFASTRRIREAGGSTREASLDHADGSSPSAWVTRAGQMIHTEGWLRSGPTEEAARDSESGSPHATERGSSTVLVRERELRQLPADIQRLDTTIEELERRRNEGLQRLDDVASQASALAKTVQKAEAGAQEMARKLAALQREEERAQNDVQVCKTVAEQLVAETAGLDQEVGAATVRLGEYEGAQQEAAERVAEAQDVIDELVERNRAQEAEITAQKTALAVQEQDAKATAQRADQMRAQARDLAAHLERRAERTQALASQRAELEAQLARHREAATETRAQIAALSKDLGAADTSVAEAERAQAELDHRQGEARQHLAAAEVEYRGAMVEAQRASDGASAIAAQIRAELTDLGELSEAEGALDEGDHVAIAGMLGMQPGTDEGAADAPRTLSNEEAAKMRRQIDQLRNRLRNLGGYDPDAPQAYAELKTRYDFLTGQVRDLEQAATNLRTIITELDTTMRRQFAETFEAVNWRFQRHFVTLFNGGAARLELTAPRRSAAEEDENDEPEPTPAKGPGLGGVEVFVQIPGKRVQDLSLLSGGERAMVSAALLFALLETNPPPFCLLDEVDAALDEANVVRFCEILKTLAQETQFVVITHNRVTMTHAGAIYGVSMGADSISRVLSMRLAEVRAAR